MYPHLGILTNGRVPATSLCYYLYSSCPLTPLYFAFCWLFLVGGANNVRTCHVLCMLVNHGTPLADATRP